MNLISSPASCYNSLSLPYQALKTDLNKCHDLIKTLNAPYPPFYVTLIAVTTIPQIAGGCLKQQIHVVFAAVTNPDESRPFARIARPMKTNLAWNNPFSHCWVRTIKPAWRMRSAVMCGYNLIRHLCTCASFELIPIRCKWFITFEAIHDLESFGTVRIIQYLVVWTFYCKTIVKKMRLTVVITLNEYLVVQMVTGYESVEFGVHSVKIPCWRVVVTVFLFNGVNCNDIYVILHESDNFLEIDLEWFMYRLLGAIPKLLTAIESYLEFYLV